MNHLSHFSKGIPALAALAIAVSPAFAQTTASGESLTMEQEKGDLLRWYFSPGVGFANFEGDQPLKDGLYITLRLGYDLTEHLSAEGGFAYAPSLDENMHGTQGADGLWYYPDADGQYRGHARQGSRSKGADSNFGDTWMGQAFIDLLYHFSKWERCDPYIGAGIGLDIYGEEVYDDKVAAALRLGAGFFYHFTDSLALRIDTRVLLESGNTEFNHYIDVGLCWTWGGGKIIDDTPVTTGPLDSDGDGLTDRYELQIGTDPYDPDTDGDGLTDGEEVLTYHTDPRNPDSDFDMLSDGAEILKYGTNPLDPDTDKGGVRDGHEVLVDGTDPRPGHGDDDVMLVRLNVQFDTDKWDIKEEFDSDLQKVVKVLQRNPGATALIEGHADKRQTSNARHNLILSKNRAAAIRQYFVDNGIEASRLTSEGFGFNRPIAPNDPVNGNVENRRVEVYISGVQDKKVQYVNP